MLLSRAVLSLSRAACPPMCLAVEMPVPPSPTITITHRIHGAGIYANNIWGILMLNPTTIRVRESLTAWGL